MMTKRMFGDCDGSTLEATLLLLSQAVNVIAADAAMSKAENVLSKVFSSEEMFEKVIFPNYRNKS